ncbi:UNVERIFIED_CONTAM: hypothetical protein FKN15_070936 [Acipenser sinensis]
MFPCVTTTVYVRNDDSSHRVPAVLRAAASIPSAEAMVGCLYRLPFSSHAHDRSVWVHFADMIAVDEIISHGEDNPFRILKPWWDVFAEYLIIFMIMISVFAGTLQSSASAFSSPLPRERTSIAPENIESNVQKNDGVFGNPTARMLDKLECEQAKALFEKVKKFRLYTEKGDILYKMYMRQTMLRLFQSFIITTYVWELSPNILYIVHCIDDVQVTGFREFFCIHALRRMYTMLSYVYIAVICLYMCTCIYTLYWIYFYKLKDYSFEKVRDETGINDIPDVTKDFAFLLHLIDQYDKLYARKFAVFLSDVSENKLRQLNLNYEWSTEKLEMHIVTNTDQKKELHLFMLPGIPNSTYEMVQLEVLKLELINDISIGEGISQLKSLNELWLYNCTIKVENKALVFLKVNLHIMRVKFSKIEEIPQWMYNLSNLKELHLEGDLQTDSKTCVLQSMRDLERLQLLHLKTNVIKVPLTITTDIAQHLLHLTINNQGTKLLSLNSVKKFYVLATLKLISCNLERIPSAIFSLSHLTELDLKDNNLKSIEEIASFQHFCKLRILKLHYNSVVDIPLYIAKVASVEMLYLNKNKISELPPHLFKLSKLFHLELAFNCIKEIPAEIEELEELQYLGIDNNSITKLPQELFKCTKLRVLILSHNLLTHIPPNIEKLTHLRQLEIAGNQLSELPPELGNCACLKREHVIVEEEYFNTLPHTVREGFGPYESYDSGSAQGGPDLYRSGFGGSFGGGYDQFDNDESNWKPSYPRSNLRSGFMDNEGRDGYSSYGRFSSPHMKPAPIGSRGRGMPAYPQNKFGGRSHDLGGPTAIRGRGRGPVGFFGKSRPGIIIDYQNQTAMRGVKRKMMPPSRPNTFIKKQKVTKPALINKPGTSVNKTDEEEQRKLEARREKQRRRREKNNEKYGDGYRLAYTCSFCKFRTFEEKDIEDHFESSSHQETLDYIQKQANFEEDVIRFLHESMVNKFRKTVFRKTRNCHPELTREEELKEAMEGVTEEDYMRKVDIIHCSACHTYVPAVIFSVKQHLTSEEHLKSKVGYKEQLRKESVLTATSILNNPIVKARYEKFAKGEDPFEITEESQQQDDGEQNDAAEDAELNPDDDPAAEIMKVN